MGSVVSALAFPAPNPNLSRRALLQRGGGGGNGNGNGRGRDQLVYLTTKSGHRIPAVHITTPTSTQPDNKHDNHDVTFTILYSHGNAEDVGLSLPYLDYLSQVCHCHVLAYEYCGYSIAQGEPSEDNCYECIDAAYTYLTTQQNIPPSQIVLFGRSLGTGPTIDLAARLLCKKSPYRPYGDGGTDKEERIAGCVLQSPLESGGRCILGELASYVLYPFDIFRSYEKMKHLGPIPVLFMHGLQDKVVPSASGQALYQTWREVATEGGSTTAHAHVTAKECQPLWIRDAGHNDMPEYLCLETTRNFLDYLNRFKHR